MAFNHIVLCGFKHVGKSTVGRLLAAKRQQPFIDLDTQIEKNYRRQTKQSLSCREIHHQHGDVFFRECETIALRQVLKMPAAVIALGGGTLFFERNRTLLAFHRLIYLTAASSIVYARLLATGKPAYFPTDQDPEQFFQQRWRQHEELHTRSADFVIDNSGSIEQTVEHIFKCIPS